MLRGRLLDPPSLEQSEYDLFLDAYVERAAGGHNEGRKAGRRRPPRPLGYLLALFVLGSAAGFPYVSLNGPIPWTWTIAAVLAMA